MQTFDIKPLFQTAQSFDRIWDELNTSFSLDHRGYPDYNVLRTDETSLRISLAVPGYQQSEISVETHEGALWIRGRKDVDPHHNQYLYQGIRNQQFERSFQLPEHVKVTGARLEAGLLHIDLVKEVPEELNRRQIETKVDQGTEITHTAEAA